MAMDGRSHVAANWRQPRVQGLWSAVRPPRRISTERGRWGAIHPLPLGTRWQTTQPGTAETGASSRWARIDACGRSSNNSMKLTPLSLGSLSVRVGVLATLLLGAPPV